MGESMLDKTSSSLKSFPQVLIQAMSTIAFKLAIPVVYYYIFIISKP